MGKEISNLFMWININFKEKLLINSFFIALSLGISGAFGFIFLFLLTLIYEPYDIGLYSAIYSAIGLIVLISRVGLDQSLIKFFPEGDQNQIFNTTLIATSILSSLIGIIVIGFVYTKDIDFSMNSLFYICFFLIFILFLSLFSNVNNAFVALREPRWTFFLNLLTGSRIFLIFLFFHWGYIGILLAIFISLMISSVVSLVILKKYGIRLRWNFNINYVKNSFIFSIGNYLNNIFMVAPTFLFPILIVTILGPEETAYYSIAFSIISLALILPSAISTSVFVEGSHGMCIQRSLKEIFLLNYLLLILIALFVFIFGEILLKFIGEEYLGVFPLLKILMLSCFPISTIYIHFSLKRIENNMPQLLYISALIFIFLIISSNYFIHIFGLIGSGYAWLFSYTIGVFSILPSYTNTLKIT